MNIRRMNLCIYKQTTGSWDMYISVNIPDDFVMKDMVTWEDFAQAIFKLELFDAD